MVLKGFLTELVEKTREKYIKRRVRKNPKTYGPFTVAPVTVARKIRSPKHIIQNRTKKLPGNSLLFIPFAHSLLSLVYSIR